MNITLTPEHEQLIQQKLQSGRYQNIDDLLLQAFQLLDDWEESSLTEDPDWIATTQSKVDAAIVSLEANGGHDGETVVNQLLDRNSSFSSKKRNGFGILKEKISMTEDFDAPLEEFEEC